MAEDFRAKVTAELDTAEAESKPRDGSRKCQVIPT